MTGRVDQVERAVAHHNEIHKFVEASPGQLEDELRLALSHAGARGVPDIESIQHYGGVLPAQDEIAAKVRTGDEVRA